MSEIIFLKNYFIKDIAKIIIDYHDYYDLKKKINKYMFDIIIKHLEFYNKMHTEYFLCGLSRKLIS